MSYHVHLLITNYILLSSLEPKEAIGNERKDLLDSCNRQWESLYRQRDKEEGNMLKMRFQEQEEQDEEVKCVRMEHQEKYRQTKIKLDSDIQVRSCKVIIKFT